MGGPGSVEIGSAGHLRLQDLDSRGRGPLPTTGKPRLFTTVNNRRATTGYTMPTNGIVGGSRQAEPGQNVRDRESAANDPDRGDMGVEIQPKSQFHAAT